MNAAERRNRIVEYLRIKPISHGQVYTFQIAVPASEVVDIKDERREYLQRSLTDKGTNLIPLIVRRTEAYSEEEEYEVVYGADWCLVAKELDIEKLWVWVFDMTDEQAAAAKEEMQQLAGYSNSIPVAVQPTSETTESIKPIVETINQTIEQGTASTKEVEASENKQTTTDDKLVQPLTQSVRMIIEEMYQKLATLNQKIDEVTASVKKLEASEIKQIAIDDKLVQQVTQTVKECIKEILSQQSEQTSKQINIPPQTKQKDYDRMTNSQLKVIASELNIKGRSNMNKGELIAAIKKAELK